MLVHPSPGALVWPAAMIVWGPGFTTAGHRHHCVQLVMAMRGTLLIRGRSERSMDEMRRRISAARCRSRSRCARHNSPDRLC